MSSQLFVAGAVIGPVIGFVGLLTVLDWIAVERRRPVSRA